MTDFHTTFSGVRKNLRGTADAQPSSSAQPWICEPWLYRRAHSSAWEAPSGGWKPHKETC